jgi:hypothetical protein
MTGKGSKYLRFETKYPGEFGIFPSRPTFLTRRDDEVTPVPIGAAPRLRCRKRRSDQVPGEPGTNRRRKNNRSVGNGNVCATVLSDVGKFPGRFVDTASAAQDFWAHEGLNLRGNDPSG